jgi:hypothetical protein
MTLATAEFIRRFLIHVLPQGFHRIRHYGLFASGTRADNVARARELLAVAKPERQPTAPPPIKPSRTVHAAAVAWSSLGLRARCSAMASADRSDNRHQDRHLMTASQYRKNARRIRCLSAGDGKARSDIQPSSQIVRHSPRSTRSTAHV